MLQRETVHSLVHPWYTLNQGVLPMEVEVFCCLFDISAEEFWKSEHFIYPPEQSQEHLEKPRPFHLNIIRRHHKLSMGYTW